MIKRPASPSQGWLTFLRNHSTQMAVIDLFVGRHVLLAHSINSPSPADPQPAPHDRPQRGNKRRPV